MKAYMGSRSVILLIFCSAVDGGEWAASRPDSFTPGRRHGTHWKGAKCAPETVWTVL